MRFEISDLGNRYELLHVSTALLLQSEPMDAIEARRRIPSKVPVRGTSRYRTLSTKKVAEKPSEKCKRIVQQCFTQLENKDW